MSAQVVLMGPSAAGKTSLMLGLSRQTSEEFDFTVDKTWSTQKRRPNEGDDEKNFVSQDEFDRNRPYYLFSFRTFATYEYGIPRQAPLGPNEVRMRILTPVFAVKFREMVEAPTLLCSVAPYTLDPEQVIRTREPNIDPKDMQSRLMRFERDREESEALADIKFQNTEGLDIAVQSLRTIIESFLGCRDLDKEHLHKQ